MMSSENVVEISTPPAAKVVVVKFDQLMSTRVARPVTGSYATSANSLSAASRAFAPFSKPCGFVAVVTSNGPCQVCP